MARDDRQFQTHRRGDRHRDHRRATNPEARLLAIFDVFDGWFHKKSFEGCSFINVLLESKTDSQLHKAAAIHLAKIRAIVCELAGEAGLQEPRKFAQVYMLMKGSIISAREGNRRAAREAKFAVRLVLKGWKYESKTVKTAVATSQKPISR